MPETAHMSDDTPSQTLAAFAAGLSWADIPDPVKHAAKGFLINYFACAMAGSGEPAIVRQLPLLQTLSGAATASIIGHPQKADPLWAASLNAASANLFDFDDTHFPTILHPTAPVAPVLFALAESRPGTLSGKDLLLALVIGIEIQCRIGNAVSPQHYRRGSHITATCGVFGAALAAGRVLGLNSKQLHAALGHASAQAGGLVETLGTASKSIGVGNAARNGLLSAFLAAEGLTGPALPLEGAYGFLNVASPEPVAARLTEGLGQHWELLANICKPFPCGVVLNPVIDACLALREQPGFDAASITAIKLTGHPLLAERANRPDVATGNLSQVSAQHAVAVSLLRGKAGLAEFSDEAVRDPAIRALGHRVSFIDDPSFTVDAARVEISLATGTTLDLQIDHARGTLQNPPSDVDLEAKLAALLAYRGLPVDPAPLAKALWSLDTITDAATIMTLLQPHSQSKLKGQAQ